MRVILVAKIAVALGGLTLAGCSSSEASGDSTGSAPGLAAADDSPPGSTTAERQGTTTSTLDLGRTELVGYEDDATVADAAFAVVEGLLTLPPGEALTPVAAAAAGDRALLPDGATMTIRRPTWERRGRLAAVVVDVQLAGAEGTDEFIAFLVATEAGWRLSHTERLGP